MWITDYRAANNLELRELQQKVNDYLHYRFPDRYFYISAKLIHILEYSSHPKTHPLIATIIADVCQATPEQFDMIVMEQYQGIYKPMLTLEALEALTAKAKPATSPLPVNCRAVVKLDNGGYIIAKYHSVEQAAKDADMPSATIRNRCKRKVASEFTPFVSRGILREYPYTFRYADEWEAMTPEQQRQDMKNGREGIQHPWQ